MEWVHVDYKPRLRGFYASYGFHPTVAGLMGLAQSDGSRHLIYRRYFTAEDLAEELYGEVLFEGAYLVAVRR